LREEEEEVRAEIQRALERENIDRERGSATPEQEGKDEDKESEDDRTSESTDGAVRTSMSLREDLREVQKKVERFQKRRELEDIPSVKATSESLVECYRYVLLSLYDVFAVNFARKKKPEDALRMLERGVRVQEFGRTG